jgi:hypothetical protein
LRATMEPRPEQRGGLHETALTVLGPLEVEALAARSRPRPAGSRPHRLDTRI